MTDMGDLELTGTVEVEEGKFDYVRGIGDAGMYFLPEVHQARYGTDPRRGMRSYIPKDMGGLYRELILERFNYEGRGDPITTRQFLEKRTINYPEFNAHLISDEVVQQLRERVAPIYFGDVDVTEFDHWLLDEANQEMLGMGISVMNLILLWVMNKKGMLTENDSNQLNKALTNLDLDLDKPRTKSRSISRRDFLKGFLASGATFSLWLMSPEMFYDAMAFAYDKGADINSALLRKMADAYGLSALFHPENLVVNFRNMYWAQNLLLIQEQANSQDLKIGVAAGAAHANLKQFYAIGREFGRATLMALMCAYPKEVLKKLVEAAGGLDNFCLVNEYKPDNQNDEGYALSRSIQNNDLKKLLRRRGVS